MWLNPRRVTLARFDRRWNYHEEIVWPRLFSIAESIERKQVHIILTGKSVKFFKKFWKTHNQDTWCRIFRRTNFCENVIKQISIIVHYYIFSVFFFFLYIIHWSWKRLLNSIQMAIKNKIFRILACWYTYISAPEPGLEMERTINE